MNNIFYWLWLADAFEAISGLSGLLVLGYGLAFVFCVFVFFVTCSEGDSLSEHACYVSNTLSQHKKICKVLLCPLLISLVFVVALPSKTTIYASLGMSVTADLVQNPTAQKALRLLNNKLDDLLQEKEGKK